MASWVPGNAKVLFNTPWEEERLRAHGVEFPNVDFLPPSVDLDELARTPKRSVKGVPSGKLLCAFVGRITQTKGIDVLLESFARARARIDSERPELVRDLHLVVAGFQDSDERFEGLAKNLGLGGCTTFLYDRPREDIINLLRQSRIFLFPSRVETFGIAVIEAWATGNLVVVSDRSALPFVVRHEVDGIVVSLEHFAVGVLRALRMLDTAEGDRLVSSGEETLRTLYTRPAQISKLIDLVGEMLPARAAS